MSGIPQVRRATADDRDLVVEILCEAFDDDPVTNWLLRKDAGRARAFREFYKVTFSRFAIEHDHSFIANDNQGAALWLPPNAWQLGLLTQISLAPYILKCVGLGGVGRALRFLDGADKAHPHEPHWYLLIVGVKPGAQGQGLGRALIEPMLAKCDAEGIPAYLETTKPSNVPYYRRFGFEVHDQIDLGKGAPEYSTMWRPPQAR